MNEIIKGFIDCMSTRLYSYNMKIKRINYKDENNIVYLVILYKYTLGIKLYKKIGYYNSKDESEKYKYVDDLWNARKDKAVKI